MSLGFRIAGQCPLRQEIRGEDGAGSSVWRYEEGQARRVPVSTGGPRNNCAIEISGPALRDGDQIIVAGANLLREGQKIRLMETAQ